MVPKNHCHIHIFICISLGYFYSSFFFFQNRLKVSQHHLFERWAACATTPTSAGEKHSCDCRTRLKAASLSVHWRLCFVKFTFRSCTLNQEPYWFGTFQPLLKNWGFCIAPPIQRMKFIAINALLGHLKNFYSTKVWKRPFTTGLETSDMKALVIYLVLCCFQLF